MTQFVRSEGEWLDAVTGEELLLFVPDDGIGSEAAQVGRAVARALDVRLDALPAAVLFVPSIASRETVVVALKRFAPRRRRAFLEDDLQTAFLAITEAAHQAGTRRPGERLRALRDELVACHSRAFPTADEEIAPDWRTDLTTGASVVAALAALVKLFSG